LDKASQALLDRGARLTELLKQGQYKPLSVEEQILIIYAGNRGFLDDFEVSKIQKYEVKLFGYLNKEHPELIKKLRKKMEIDAELDQEISSALKSFNKQFGEEKE